MIEVVYVVVVFVVVIAIFKKVFLCECDYFVGMGDDDSCLMIYRYDEESQNVGVVFCVRGRNLNASSVGRVGGVVGCVCGKRRMHKNKICVVLLLL